MDTIDRIFDLMFQKKITAAQLTREAGLTQGLVTQWKQRKQNPSMDSITKVAAFFGVTVDYLLGKMDDPTPENKKKAPSVDTKEAALIYARSKLGREPTPEDLAMIESAVDIAVQHIGNHQK